MSHMHTPGSIAHGQMPGAWYDLSARIGEAQSVACCALESLPSSGLQGFDCARINHSSNLIAAMQDILHLMEADAKMIETQLKL